MKPNYEIAATVATYCMQLITNHKILFQVYRTWRQQCFWDEFSSANAELVLQLTWKQQDTEKMLFNQVASLSTPLMLV